MGRGATRNMSPSPAPALALLPQTFVKPHNSFPHYAGKQSVAGRDAFQNCISPPLSGFFARAIYSAKGHTWLETEINSDNPNSPLLCDQTRNRPSSITYEFFYALIKR